MWNAVGRVAAWALIPLLLLQFLSGYAILHPRIFEAVLGRVAAFRLHEAVQPFTVAAFALHGLPWIARRVTRPGRARTVLGTALAIVGAGLVAFSIYLWALG